MNMPQSIDDLLIDYAKIREELAEMSIKHMFNKSLSKTELIKKMNDAKLMLEALHNLNLSNKEIEERLKKLGFILFVEDDSIYNYGKEIYEYSSPDAGNNHYYFQFTNSEIPKINFEVKKKTSQNL